MYSPTFMRFLIGRDADDFLVEEKDDTDTNTETKPRPIDNVIYRCSKYVTIPIEIKYK